MRSIGQSAGISMVDGAARSQHPDQPCRSRQSRMSRRRRSRRSISARSSRFGVLSDSVFGYRRRYDQPAGGDDRPYRRFLPDGVDLDRGRAAGAAAQKPKGKVEAVIASSASADYRIRIAADSAGEALSSNAGTSSVSSHPWLLALHPDVQPRHQPIAHIERACPHHRNSQAERCWCSTAAYKQVPHSRWYDSDPLGLVKR